MYQHFKIEGLEYGMGISKSGNVWLDLLGGVTRKGSAYRNPCKDLFWDEPCFADVDLGANTLRVFREAQGILLSQIHTKKPGRFGFSASTRRKERMYRWMACRLSERLGNYTLVEFPDGVFNFYRLAEEAHRGAKGVEYVTC